jgi:hypothetical protein
VLVTAKDWAKLGRVPAERWPCAVARPRLEMGFDAGEATVRGLVLGVAAGGESGGD